MAIFAQYVAPITSPATKTLNFNAGNSDEYDREFANLKALANRYEPGFCQPDFRVKEICDLILHGTKEIVCDRAWRDWKKRVGVAITPTGTHDAGSFFALRLVAEFKKEMGSKVPMTMKALLEYAKRQKTQVSAAVIGDSDYEFPGRLFPTIAYHLTGLRLSESYLYQIFRSKLNLQFRRGNVYTIKQAETYLTQLGYPLLREQKAQQVEAQKILDAIFMQS